MHSHLSGLHDAHSRNAKPKEKLYRLNDFKGLYLEVKPNAWRHRFKVNDKTSWLALGDYPSVSLAENPKKPASSLKQESTLYKTE